MKQNSNGASQAPNDESDHKQANLDRKCYSEPVRVRPFPVRYPCQRLWAAELQIMVLCTASDPTVLVRPSCRHSCLFGLIFPFSSLDTYILRCDEIRDSDSCRCSG